MKRILLKLSGEALAGPKKPDLTKQRLWKLQKVKVLVEEGIQVGIVIGGGNFWRGRTSENIDGQKQTRLVCWLL